MLKPELVVVEAEGRRVVEVKMGKVEGEVEVAMRMDFRESMAKAREKNKEIKAEMTKKAEEEGTKKGGKPPKGEPELKVNCFNEPVS
jgi:hypothetical protein